MKTKIMVIIGIVCLLIIGGINIMYSNPFSGEEQFRSANQIEALIEASAKGQNDKVKELIKSGVNVNAQSSIKPVLNYGSRGGAGGDIALIEASRNGHIEVVKTLLANGANPDAQNKSGHTALIDASNHLHFDIVKILIESGAKIGRETVSSDAIRFANIEMVNFLLKSNFINKNVAIWEAAANGETEIIKLLIDAGADVNAVSVDENWNWGYSVLDKILYPGEYVLKDIPAVKKQKTIELLKSAGAYSLESILQSVKQGDVGTVKKWLNRKDIKQIAKEYILWNSVKNGNIEVVKLLIENGVNPNLLQLPPTNFYPGAGVEPNLGRTILDIAMDLPSNTHKEKSKKQEIVQFLKTSGSFSSGFIMEVALKNDAKTINKFIGQSDLDIKNKNTLLIIATKAASIDIVKLMLHAGADPNASHIYGFRAFGNAYSDGMQSLRESVLDIAMNLPSNTQEEKAKKQQIIKLLQDAGAKRLRKD